MPNDRTLSFTFTWGKLCATTAWVAAVTMLAAGTAADHMALLAWGLAFVGVAVVMQVRCYFARQNALFRSAFELGRDSAHMPTNGVTVPLQRR